MENRRNYYRILHVQHDAPTAIIQTSYRTLMQRLRAHPDLGGDHWNAALINEAYAVLTDPVRRAAYDKEFKARGGGQTAAAAAGQPGMSVPVPGAAVMPPESRPAGACGFCRAPLNSNAAAEGMCPNCGSPLEPALRRHLETSGKRSIGRLDRQFRLKCWNRWPGRPFSAETRDISLNGVQIASQQPAYAGDFWKVECDAFDAIIRVIAAEPPGADHCWRIRAEFATLRFRRALGAFVSASV